MKNFLKDLLWLIVLGLGCGCVDLLFRLLCGWMFTWSSAVVAIALIVLVSSSFGIPYLCGAAVAALPFKTIVGVVLACLNTISYCVYSLRAVWVLMPPSGNKQIAICVYATLFFIIFYGMAIVMIISAYKDRREGK